MPNNALHHRHDLHDQSLGNSSQCFLGYHDELQNEHLVCLSPYQKQLLQLPHQHLPLRTYLDVLNEFLHLNPHDMVPI